MEADDLPALRNMLANAIADAVGGGISTSAILMYGVNKITFDQMTEVARAVLEWSERRERERDDAQVFSFTTPESFVEACCGDAPVAAPSAADHPEIMAVIEAADRLPTAGPISAQAFKARFCEAAEPAADRGSDDHGFIVTDLAPLTPEQRASAKEIMEALGPERVPVPYWTIPVPDRSAEDAEPDQLDAFASPEAVIAKALEENPPETITATGAATLAGPTVRGEGGHD